MASVRSRFGHWAIVAFTSAVVATGCTDPEYPTTCADMAIGADWSAEEAEHIEHAAARWQAVGANVHVVREERSVCTLRRGAFEGHTTDQLGCFDHSQRVSTINADAIQGWPLFELVAMHELGHSVGMQHLDGADIMNTNIGASDPTPDDMAECRRVGACSTK